MAKGTKYRMTLDDEQRKWMATGLRSIAQSGGRSPERKQWLIDLADRVAEKGHGNPWLTLKGRRTREEPLPRDGGDDPQD